MKKVFLFVAVATLGFLTSCNKKEVTVLKPDLSDGEGSYEQTNYNLDVRDFAMAVNEAINTNASFRGLIKDEVNKMFDGDYNVLITDIVDAKVDNYQVDENGKIARAPGNISVRDLLNSAFEKIEKEKIKEGETSFIRRKQAAPALSIVDRITQQYPDLQVAVPFHVEQLEDQNYIPPVVFLPEEYSEDTTRILPVFRNKKNYSIDAKLIPDSAHIVVSKNERLEILREVFKTPPPSPVSFIGRLFDVGISLSWTNTSPLDLLNSYGYKIYRKKNNENYTLLYTNNSQLNTSYIDTDIELNNVYFYYVVAYNASGSSDPIYCNGGEGIYVHRLPAHAKSFSVNPTRRNTARVRWLFDLPDNNGKIEIFRRNEGSDYTTPFFSADLPIIGNECLDEGVPAGARLEYKIERTTTSGTSAPVYDIMYMPYRDVSQKSKVVIKRVKISDVSAVESWRGAPEYVIKGYRVKNNGSGSPYSTFSTTIECRASKGGRNNTWEDVYKEVVSDWRPGFDGAEWYDVITFQVVEYDGKSIFDDKLDDSANLARMWYKRYKDEIEGNTNSTMQRAFPWAEVIITAVEVALQIPQWINSEDDKIGYAHLNYFDRPTQTFNISAEEANAVFSMEIGD